MQADAIGDYRERFRAVPYGVWSVCPTAPDEQTIRFFGNQRGVCNIAQGLGGETIHFEWRSHEDFCLLVRRIDQQGRDADEEWLCFRYDFETLRVKGSDSVVMRLIEFGRLVDFPEPLFLHADGSYRTDDRETTQNGLEPPRESILELLHGRIPLALFCTGLIGGIALLALREMQFDVDPLVYGFAAIGLFAYFYYKLAPAASTEPTHPEDGVRDRD